jgi:hypothetical protein
MESVDVIDLAQDRYRWQASVNTVLRKIQEISGLGEEPLDPQFLL